jgi:hypothetical protein
LPPLAVKDTYKVGFAQLWEDHGPRHVARPGRRSGTDAGAD